MVDIHAIYMRFQDHFRPPRMRAFAKLCNVDESKRIIDIGGDEQNWRYIDQKPPVTIVNIDVEDRYCGRFRHVFADGRALPFEDRDFDVAFSNSVIEHVGDWDDKRRFANEIRRVSRKYFVQTPNRWFVVEPHFIAVLIHFLPKRLFRKLLPLGSLWFWLRWPSKSEIDRQMGEIDLLTESQMRELFPDAEIIRERFLGLTKSLIAVRN